MKYLNIGWKKSYRKAAACDRIYREAYIELHINAIAAILLYYYPALFFGHLYNRDMSGNNIVYATTPNSSIELTYGPINPQDIPVILKESHIESGSRMIIWVSLVVVVLLILVYYSIQKQKEAAILYTAEMNLLIDKRQSELRKYRMSRSELDVPAAKYIHVHIPLSAFSRAPIGRISCIFSFVATTTKQSTLQLEPEWSIEGDQYHILLSLPNYVGLTSMVIHVNPTALFSHNWNKSFNSAHIYVHDSSDRVIWKDHILVDFDTGDATSGYTYNGYIPIQFDLDKYI